MKKFDKKKAAFLRFARILFSYNCRRPELRLRNLSGIIVVDFINMEAAADREELMQCLTQHCLEDPVRTNVVDMTRLGLVEITRKKTRKPLQEQVRMDSGKANKY